MTAYIQNLHSEFIAARPYLACNQEVVAEFVRENGHIISGKDIDYVIDLLTDYVGSQGLYEEGCEEEW